MLRKIWLLVFVVLVSGCGSSVNMQLRKDTAPGALNPVSYFTGFSGTLNREQTVLFIRGTGRFPASHDFGMGAEATLVGFSVVYPQKSYVDDEEQYYRHDHREQRLHDLCAVIDDLIAHGAKRILLLADSEGTLLAPEIAARYSRYVCGLVCIGGSVFTFEEDLRYSAVHEKGVFAQTGNLDLQKHIALIAKDPKNIEKDLLGHSYRFWSSYLHYDPTGHLKSLTCPVLFLNGENDDLDMAKQTEIIHQWQTEGIPIEQKVYPGLGHELKAVGKALARDILAWAQSHRIVNSADH